jgi:heterodisulfide reductase subunit B
MLLGCVQPAMMPNINSATARVLDAAGIQTLVADDAGCCGAIRTHLGDVPTAAWPTCAATSTPGGRWSPGSPAKARSRPS